VRIWLEASCLVNSKVARAIGTGKRTLARSLQAVLGKTPFSYFQDIRVEHAVYLLCKSNDSVDQIAAQVDYSSGKMLRSLIHSKIGRSVSELHMRN
jgi:transcriptional regulator GlxA family with amidase domain